jgi:hypothetical protein
MPTDTLAPFRWPSAWKDPSMVGLLAGGPVNCVLVDSAAGAIAEAARAAGLTVMEWSALHAAPLEKIGWDSPDARVVITDLFWPRMKMSQRGQPDDAEAGPTGAPWIDSNSWVARLAAVRAPAKPVWLSFEPDPKEGAPGLAGYITAIADSAAAGAQWIVKLDESLAQGLAAGKAEAVQQWRGIAAALGFFEKHKEWRGWEPWGALGVLSSFAGKDAYLGQEVLNLASRRNLLYRILDRSIPASQKLETLRAVLYVDEEPPGAELKGRLLGFARAGGLLIVPRSLAAQFPGERPLHCAVAGYEMRTLGQGRVAAAAGEWDDPYFLAADVHSLVSRRNDPVRLFNGRSLWVHYAVRSGSAGALLQLVSFASRANASVTVAGERAWRSAKMHVIGSETPTALEPRKVESLTEFNLPVFTNYAAVEFEA